MKDAIFEAAEREGLGLVRADLDAPERLEAFTRTDALRSRRNHKGQPLGGDRYDGLCHGKRVAQLFEDLAEGGLWDPTFVTDYPTEISPLSKARPDDPSTTERFELFAAGMEIANGFSELNDPLEQRAALPGPASSSASAGRRRGPPHGRRLRPRPRPRPAAHRRLRRRHRPPGHDPHRTRRRSAT